MSFFLGSFFLGGLLHFKTSPFAWRCQDALTVAEACSNESTLESTIALRVLPCLSGGTQVSCQVTRLRVAQVTCNTGNFGRRGDKREQQLIFRNDEFVQHGVDHIMIELRTATGRSNGRVPVTRVWS